jgi:hypothetical protein
MKKIMSLMLGLSLLSGMAVFAADNTKAPKTKKTGTTSKGKKKKATSTSTAPAPKTPAPTAPKP